jgi:hypothetical protein
MNMKYVRWGIRFGWVFAVVFVILASASYIRGRDVAQVFVDSIVWALISSTIFFASRNYYLRRGKKCDVCEAVLPSQDT